MDQRPGDMPPRSSWERATRKDDGSWSVLPLLLLVAVLAIGAWMLFADGTNTPSTTTTENVPGSGPVTKPSAPTTPPAATPPATPAPAPATKP